MRVTCSSHLIEWNTLYSGPLFCPWNPFLFMYYDRNRRPMPQMLGLELRNYGEVTTKGRWKEEEKGCVREGVISDMYSLFRPKFWENLTSPLFGTLSPPSVTSEVSGERRDSAERLWG